jgi:hypothetical protein
MRHSVWHSEAAKVQILDHGERVLEDLESLEESRVKLAKLGISVFSTLCGSISAGYWVSYLWCFRETESEAASRYPHFSTSYSFGFISRSSFWKRRKL